MNTLASFDMLNGMVKAFPFIHPFHSSVSWGWPNCGSGVTNFDKERDLAAYVLAADEYHRAYPDSGIKIIISLVGLLPDHDSSPGYRQYAHHGSLHYVYSGEDENEKISLSSFWRIYDKYCAPLY